MFQLPDRLPLKFTQSKGVWKALHSPNDNKVLTKFQVATLTDMETILEGNKEAQRVMGKLRPFERAKILKAVAHDLSTQLEFLAWVIASEGGKPLKDARVEAARAVSTLELCAEETLRLEGEMISMERTEAGKDHLAFTLSDPIGPVLAISAFNHPLNLIAHQVGCAVASGCAVVLKPSSSTPLSAHFLEEAFLRAGLPKVGLRVVNANVEVVEKLVTSSEFNYVSFIGSAKVGWEMRRRIAPGTRIAMEHGGQAAAIVRMDADLDQASRSLVKGAFYHAGQVCISTQRIFVHESVFSPFLAKFMEGASELNVGVATDPKTDVGPLIRPTEVERIQKWIQEAKEMGAMIEMGNNIAGEERQFLYPTVLTNVPRNATVMKEEVFGPVVCINPYKDENELLEYLNSNDYIFESSLFTKDISHAMKVARDISTMTFVINNHTAFRIDQMPFGGHKMSGLGMGGVKYVMREMTRLKQVIIKI